MLCTTRLYRRLVSSLRINAKAIGAGNPKANLSRLIRNVLRTNSANCGIEKNHLKCSKSFQGLPRMPARAL